jgi:hypothetical protein
LKLRLPGLLTFFMHIFKFVPTFRPRAFAVARAPLTRHALNLVNVANFAQPGSA